MCETNQHDDEQEEKHIYSALQNHTWLALIYTYLLTAKSHNMIQKTKQ